MGIQLRKRWAGQPLWARWILAVYLTGFLEGACAHLLDLIRGGIHAYASFPQVSIQAFFISLAVLDPLIVVLVTLVRRQGIWLASGVMVLDVSANWISNWQWLHDHPSRLLHPVGLLPITLFGLFVVTSLVPLHHTTATTHRNPQAVLPSP
ncbi:hypothetical protein [Streptomyces olivochromogenes]|uniref:Uncharacterized protein n=1 Tax=Streptomyces olivochromogenes TaxID=1963 RepID=A0A286PGX3_STROL|nr:hypothetical protein [Streptomyces olivochromogenes]GAX58802.1 hypothetical protein SO3561_10377 [Streptomyces olivochromogenes]